MTTLKIVPKWKIVEDGPKATSFWNGTLVPRTSPRKATLLTDDGPLEISIVKSKAISCLKTGKYKCPVPNCSIGSHSRLRITKHFRNEHKDYRSWRDIFLRKDAPHFILKPETSLVTESLPQVNKSRDISQDQSSKSENETSELAMSTNESSVIVQQPYQVIHQTYHENPSQFLLSSDINSTYLVPQYNLQTPHYKIFQFVVQANSPVNGYWNPIESSLPSGFLPISSSLPFHVSQPLTLLTEPSSMVVPNSIFVNSNNVAPSLFHTMAPQ